MRLPVLMLLVVTLPFAAAHDPDEPPYAAYGPACSFAAGPGTGDLPVDEAERGSVVFTVSGGQCYQASLREGDGDAIVLIEWRAYRAAMWTGETLGDAVAQLEGKFVRFRLGIGTYMVTMQVEDEHGVRSELYSSEFMVVPG